MLVQKIIVAYLEVLFINLHIFIEMKIGIVTQPLIANYGCFLQNFALQEVIKQLGHTPITIDYMPNMGVPRYILHIAKSLICACIPGHKPSFRPFNVRRTFIFQQFLDDHLQVTSTVHRYSPSLVKKYHLNAVVTGSDQVWRPAFNHSLEDMYLRFVRDKGIVKFSYAASFGVDVWEYDQKLEKKCRKWVQNLNGVSVREYSGIKLCREHLGIDAMEVLDPTLLLNRSSYERICNSVPVDSTSFVAVYVLELTQELKDLVSALSADLNMTVRICTANETATLSIPEWLSMFRDASYIITDSFHGTVFSIIFQKEFISIGNKKAGLSRFHSLLSRFKLEDRLYVPGIGSGELFNQPIHWDVVYDCLARLRKDSLFYLKKCINK